MNLTYPERLALIDMTKVRLAKMRLYVVPAQPCNDNESWNNLGWDNLDGDAPLRLIDKVGSSWQIRRTFLLGIAKGSTVEKK